MEQLTPHQIDLGHLSENPSGWEERYERKNMKSQRYLGKVSCHAFEFMPLLPHKTATHFFHFFKAIMLLYIVESFYFIEFNYSLTKPEFSLM